MDTLSLGAVRLRIYLTVRGLAQVALARAVDVSDVTAHHWIRGRIAPRAERREAIEQWTAGAVPAAAWDQEATAADLAMLPRTEASDASHG